MVRVKGKWLKKFVNSPDYNYMGIVRVSMLAKVPIANLLKGFGGGGIRGRVLGGQGFNGTASTNIPRIIPRKPGSRMGQVEGDGGRVPKIALKNT